MALTKPRAYQIYDIDYKQAVRVVTISNITLSGGAPNSVDGVNLSLNDRVLVTGQTSGAQNGIYYVTTLGSGANGTWTRSTDTDLTGELLSGTIVMVTEGTVYADTQWKLTTNDPITIGSTALTFVQNYLANSISFGATSFAIGSSNANATISVAGTSNVAVFATTGEYVTGLISATGGITGSNLVLTSGNLTLGNVTTFTSNSAIQGWSYPTISLSISASETSPTGLFVGNSGASFYVVGSTNDRVYQYNMSSTNMANTGVVFGNVAIAQDTTPNDLFFNSTGANMYVLGQTNRVVYQYTLSTPWNITTAAYATLSANVATQEATPTGLWMKPDLTTMYVVGTTNSTVYQYTLATPGNIATATYASKSVSVSTAATPQAVNLSSDGTKMWITSSSNSAIYEYNLGTAWDISTATHALGNSYNVRIQEGTPTGLYVDLANTRVWVTGQSADTVFQYNTANSIINQANAVGIQGQFNVQGNAYFGQQAVFGGAVSLESTLSVDGTLTASSTLTGSSTLALTGSTTSTTSLGTSATSGTTTIGGTAQTGAINIGRSTASQTIAIGNGVTASGSTKTIDIGTLGAANSITNINIGPTAGNSTVSFLSNAQVSIANTGTALSVAGNIIGAKDLFVGNGAASTTFLNPIAIFRDNGTGYVQVAVVNATGTASADLVTYGNNGDDNQSWMDMGFNGNAFTDTNYSITNAGDGYIFAQGNTSFGGNMVLATGNTGTTRDIVFSFGFANTDEFLRFQRSTNTVLPYANVTANIGSSTRYLNNLYAASLLGTVVSVAGNITGGNITTAGQVTATGNVSGGNLNVTGNIVDSGALTIITGSNGNIALAPNGTGIVTASGNISAAGNITGGNLLTGGLISSTGTITGGNITATSLTASGTTSGYLVNASGVSTGIAMIAASGRSSGTSGALLYLGGNSNPSGTSGYLMNGQHTLSPQQDLTSWYGLLFLPTIQTFSGNIGSMYNEFLRLDTGATGNANITNWFGSYVATPSFTVGSAPVVNTWVGYYVQDPNNAVANPTSAYAFRSNINRGTNRWGAYYAGTANNYFAGNVGIGITSAGNALDVAGTLYVTGNINGSNVNVTNVFATNGTFTNNVIVAGTLTATSNIIANTSGIFYGNTTTGNAALYAGVPGFTTLGSNVVIQVAGNANSYSQINFENINSGTEASTDYIATADNGNDSTNFVDLGIGSSTYAPVAYPAFRANDAYLLNNGGNLLLNAQTAGKLIKFIVGGSANTDVIATISNTTMSMTGAISATGNVTGSYILGNGSQLTGLPATYANANVAAYLASGTDSSNIITTANVSGGNVLATTIVSAASHIGSIVSVSANVTGGNLLTGGLISSTGNITSAANVSGGNVLATTIVSGASHIGSVVSASGNVTGANIVATTALTNGNISITGANIVSVGQTIVIDPNGSGGVDGNVIITGNLSVTGNVTYINSNNITTNDLTINVANNAATAAAANGGGIGVGPAGAEYASITYASSPNIWVVSNGACVSGIVSATANITGGNLLTSGLISATSNITSAANVSGGNVLATTIVSGASHIGSIVSVTANITGGNILTGGLISATSNITSAANVSGGNVLATTIVSGASHIGSIVSVTANITGGNLLTSGTITATGNIQTANSVVYANTTGTARAYQFYNSATLSIDTVFL